MNTPSSEDVSERVRTTLDELGYCVIGADEIVSLVGHGKPGGPRPVGPLRQLARELHAEIELAPNLKSARFVRPPASAAA